MTINDEILTAANKLANQGIKPTVARIKTKLTRPVPLPTIISILKTWQHDPTYIQPAETPPQEPTKQRDELTKTITLAVEEAITPLHKEISQLTEEVQQLKRLINQ